MRYEWFVQPYELDGKWGARWRTTEESLATGGPVYEATVSASFLTAAAARGHAAMAIARYEQALATPEANVPEEESWSPTAAELEQALAAHHSMFGAGNGVTLGG